MHRSFLLVCFSLVLHSNKRPRVSLPSTRIYMRLNRGVWDQADITETDLPNQISPKQHLQGVGCGTKLIPQTTSRAKPVPLKKKKQNSTRSLWHARCPKRLHRPLLCGCLECECSKRDHEHALASQQRSSCKDLHGPGPPVRQRRLDHRKRPRQPKARHCSTFEVRIRGVGCDYVPVYHPKEGTGCEAPRSGEKESGRAGRCGHSCWQEAHRAPCCGDDGRLA